MSVNYGFSGILSFGIMQFGGSVRLSLPTEAHLVLPGAALYGYADSCRIECWPVYKRRKDLPVALLAAWFVLLLLERRKSSGKNTPPLSE